MPRRALHPDAYRRFAMSKVTNPHQTPRISRISWRKEKEQHQHQHGGMPPDGMRCDFDAKAVSHRYSTLHTIICLQYSPGGLFGD